MKKFSRANIWEVHKESFLEQGSCGETPILGVERNDPVTHKGACILRIKDTYAAHSLGIWSYISLCTPSTCKGFSLHLEAPLLLRSPSTSLGLYSAWLGLGLAAPMTLSPLLGVQYAGSRCGRASILLLKQAVATLRTPHHANPVQGDWMCGLLLLLGERNNCYHLFSHLETKAKSKTTTTKHFRRVSKCSEPGNLFRWVLK